MTTHISDQDLLSLFLSGQTMQLTNENFKIITTDNSVQLLAKREGVIATIQRVQYTQTISLCTSSHYYETIKALLINRHFLPMPIRLGQDFEQYRRHQIPDGYEVCYTPAKLLWRAWRLTWHEHDHHRLRRKIMLMSNNNWYPIQEIGFNQGALVLRTLISTVATQPDDWVIWLNQTQDIVRPKIGLKPLDISNHWAETIEDVYPKSIEKSPKSFAGDGSGSPQKQLSAAIQAAISMKPRAAAP